MSAPRLLRQSIEAAIKQYGGLRAAARALLTDPSYLMRCMTGKKGPSDTLLVKLGLIKVVVYRRMK